jgi:flagellar hook protein FlgE
MPFRIALSGLDAAASDLKVTGNNIANASTSGFKSSRTEFADIFARSARGISKTAVGGGVRVASVTQQFSQGTVEFTQNSLDLAVNGEGFFVLSDGGTQIVSRAGAFQFDRDGYLVNAQSQRLQAYPALDPAGNNFNTASPTDFQLVRTASAPQASTSVDAVMNLQADAVDLGPGVIDPTDPTTYSYASAVTVYDSLGTSHTSSLYFRKNGTNQWDMRQYIDGSLITSGGGANAETQVTFDNAGMLLAGGTVAYDPYTPANGAAPINLTVDLSGSTQFGSPFGVTNLVQDGFTAGRLNNIEIDEQGVIAARYTNGQLEAQAKVALANFSNLNGLQQQGDNAWAETFRSGATIVGEAGQGGFGLIETGALEASNVDLSRQLVNLITAQRNYQANAQVITTADEITQTIINI